MLSLATLLLVAVSTGASANQFVVDDIRVEGNERVAEGAVFNYLPIEPGDEISSADVASAIRELYRSGFFRDVELLRDNDTLIVQVQERPSIARLEIEGNEQIRDDDLLDALRAAGLAEGQVFNRAQLAEIERELVQQYFAQGKYDVSVESTVSPLERNRVAVRIDIDEGPVAEIRSINFVGNSAFTDQQLRSVFELRPRRWWAPWSQRHRYARGMLANDLESLRRYYQDRGYIQYSITSTQVSISTDRRDVFITINMDEGEQFEVGDVQVRGHLVVPPEELYERLAISAGDIYSRSKVDEGVQGIRERLAKDGYAFSEVNVRPVIDEEERTVDLVYFVDPGARVYVRNINITGNQRTQDEVIRREMRQLEGGPLSSEALDRSRTRLNRLGFFSFVNMDTPRVPGTDDRVDVDVTVEERMTGQLQAGIGYGDIQGLLVNFSVSQDNFAGTGDRMSVTVNSSEVSNVYDLTYTDRFHTVEGVSRTLSAGYRETRARRADLADYDLTSGHSSVEYGLPVSEVDRLSARLRYEHIGIDVRGDTPDWITEYLDDEGDRFDMIKPRLSWQRDTRDRGVFPTSGGRQRLSLEGTVPGADQEFYKLNYEHRRYWPMPWAGDEVTFSVEGRASYGDGYGDSDRLPFFEHYYAGGVRTVRGYRGNYLGPRKADNGEPIGGNARILTKAQVIFPPTAEAQSVRMAAFVDAGQVFNTRLDRYSDLEDSDKVKPEGLDSVDLGELRAAAGISLIWMSPVGPLTFSLSEPLNPSDEDRTETFQFSLGTEF
ncbi:outer membrane protein assembly factor YaeT precursor [Halorhodospira halochloris]|uniref:Outer membrane protein assembly factor BamA n=2 Tax=Halorhodospira halochloris TaxID=1052 RepID=A0A0X8X8C6_HALHR|nr:outer membrane protein assembly factor BamA [Halorhodospira halochloris]BAU57457.1 outer membrane protein assembly factor YaeT precursor [Halorhodospira halochloris]